MECGGLSPLARGTAVSQLRISNNTRFIPARAGNGYCAARAGGIKSVYPRSRGDRQLIAKNFHGHYGLSPLARGTAGRFRGSLRSGRFIPARAGNGLTVTLCTEWHFFAFHILPTFLQQPILLKNGCPVDFEGVFSRRLWAVNIYRIVHPVR